MTRCSACKQDRPDDEVVPSKTQEGIHWCEDEIACNHRVGAAALPKEG